MRTPIWAACLAALCLASPASAQLIEFDAEYFVTPTGAGTGVGLVSGDWNEDGKDDLAVITTGGSVARLLGLGSFRMSAQTPIALGESGWSIASGDLDGDGHLDLVAGALAHTYLLLGDGTGDFAVAATLPYAGWDVAIARMDADADLDLVLASAGKIRVLRLEGLAVASSDSVDLFVESLDVGDFDEDGDVDVAADYQGGLGVWLNDGTGDLGPVVLWQPSGDYWDASSVSVGDLNGDGHLDVASVNSSPYSCCLTIWGRGDGTFQYTPPSASARAGAPARARPPQEPLHVAPGPHFIVLADLNGDGRDEGIDLCNEPGDEVLGARSTPSPNAATAGDFDQDGDLDVAALNDVTVAIHPIDAGALRSRWTVGVWYAPSQGRVADLDGDGIRDLLMRTEEEFAVFRGTPGGGFVRYNSGANVYSAFDLGDTDGDSIADLVAANGSYLGSSNGTFQPNPSFGGLPFSSLSLALGDLDDDGDADLVAQSTNTWEVVLHQGDGSGGFVETSRLPDSTWSVDLADFDGDGALDLAGRYLSGAFVRHGDGAGGFGPRVALATGPVSPFVIGDIDGDGHPDLLTGRDHGPRVGLAFLSRGASFDLVEGGFQGHPLVLGPLDGDAIPDLVVHDLETVALRGQGDATFVEHARFGPAPNYGKPDLAFLDDRNADGRLDLMVARSDDEHRENGSVSTFLNVTTAPVAVTPRPPLDGGLRLLGVRPLPSRGPASIAFRLPAPGTVDADVVDLQGRRVVSRRWERLSAGDHVRALDLALAPGVYTVIVRHQGVRRSTRAVVVR